MRLSTRFAGAFVLPRDPRLQLRAHRLREARVHRKLPRPAGSRRSWWSPGEDHVNRETIDYAGCAGDCHPRADAVNGIDRHGTDCAPRSGRGPGKMERLTAHPARHANHRVSISRDSAEGQLHERARRGPSRRSSQRRPLRRRRHRIQEKQSGYAHAVNKRRRGASPTQRRRISGFFLPSQDAVRSYHRFNKPGSSGRSSAVPQYFCASV